MEQVVGGSWRIDKKLGSGTFAEVYSGTNVETGENAAIKLEQRKSKHPQLLYESKIYQILQGERGFPSMKWFGSNNDYNILITDLLGPSLQDLLVYCAGRFSLKTVLLLADQMIDRIEYLHSHSFIHRDIKPSNFLLGMREQKDVLHMIDFGITKRYQNPTTGQHIPYCEGKKMTGNLRYTSLNCHLGIEQSRRDDMISLGYVLMYFLRGFLPWQDLKGTTPLRKHQNIIELKRSTHPDRLCFGYPVEFRDYFVYCLSLGFEDQPDYRYLKKMFQDLFLQHGFQNDGVFDWDLFRRAQRVVPEIDIASSNENESEEEV